jgi:hypothetical protein
MFLKSVCFISRIVLGVLASYAWFTPLYFIAAALVLFSLWFKWDTVRFFQAVAWVAVYLTAGTVTALVIVLIDIGVSFTKQSSQVQSEDQEPEEFELQEVQGVAVEAPEVYLETVPVVQSEEIHTLTPV